MKTDLTRYELFGWDYEHRAPLSGKELAWYRRFADSTPGPILELACGTGRLLSALAKMGHEAVGVDLSQTMLDLARERISRLPPRARKRVRLYRTDMSEFRFDERFGLVIMADNSFRELHTAAQQLACLENVHRHLQPGGKLLVTVRRFEPAGFVNNERHLPWSAPLRHPATGELVTRKIDMKLTEDESRIREIMTYRTMSGDGSERLVECPLESPVMLAGDYVSLFSVCGFSATVFADYDEKADQGNSTILCFVCCKD